MQRFKRFGNPKKMKKFMHHDNFAYHEKLLVQQVTEESSIDVVTPIDTTPGNKHRKKRKKKRHSEKTCY